MNDLLAGLGGVACVVLLCLIGLPFGLRAILSFSAGLWEYLLSDLWDSWWQAWRDVRDHLRGPQ